MCTQENAHANGSGRAGIQTMPSPRSLCRQPKCGCNVVASNDSSVLSRGFRLGHKRKPLVRRISYVGVQSLCDAPVGQRA
eukprot:2720899-Prorocentrum_lima.AAC.1